MRTRAFTLIELLVVIAIIALLIGILLPALGKAREVGKDTVCKTRLGQVAKAVNLYANDYKERVWPQFDWNKAPYQLTGGPPSVGKGVAYAYIENVGQTFECPKNKRANITGTQATFINPDDAQQYGITPMGVFFDYTMIGRFQGYQIGRQVQVAYFNTPSIYAPTVKPPLILGNNTVMTPMNGIPIYAEESSYWNNTGITDGLFGNGDQVTHRHFGKSNAAFVEGHAGTLNVPYAQQGETPRSPYDFDCNDLYVNAKNTWLRLEPDNVDNRVNWQVGFGMRPYGWVNSPTP
ncbi:MAG TPA: prepilin-type N-terminal cleavage/methylation domain-containing protein [Phycisphaerales bacterium]|nr:prepilin-type N-terminal cleavage/methylation domain-containing protein [Phycisphaerales bacterium]